MSHPLTYGTDEFKFDIAQPAGGSYAPGDTIIGHLVRTIPIDTPNATITLSFIGRSSVVITQTRQNKGRNHYDQSRLVNREYVVFEGLLHLPEGSEDSLTWPISVTIPLEPEESSRRYRDPECSLIPLKLPNHPDHHILPGSFRSADDSCGSCSSTCFVDYYLIANLRYHQGGQRETFETRHQITLRHPIIDTSKLGISAVLKNERVVQTQRLHPGIENADLSLKDHMQKLFHSSKVPSFKYALHLTVPTAIQLNSLNPIPLQLEIIPLSEGMSIRMILKPSTRCITPGLTKPHSNDYQTKHDLGLQDAFSNLESPLLINMGKGNESMHIGNMFQMMLTRNGLQCVGQRIKRPILDIWPDFNTYNIGHHNDVEYAVSLVVGGEKVEHKFYQVRTQIIPPA
ncbi:unnamed protein product [Penicillium pancosmium]